MSEENQNTEIFVVNGVVNYSFVKESVNKVATMSWLFSFFYYMGWSYKQWKEIKKCNANYSTISPFWRGIFFAAYFSKLKKIIVDLYEAKMNTVLQIENLPEEEKKEWERDYKNLKSAFAKLKVIQIAVNKIVPVGHPQGKLTAGDFLGVPLLAFILFVMCAFSVFINWNSCHEIEGNVFKNICNKYSLTFPLNVEISSARNQGFDLYCQEDTNETLCITGGSLDNPEDFDLETLAQKYRTVNKFSKQYAGNTTHCIEEEKDEDNLYPHICFSKIETSDEAPFYIIFFRFASDSPQKIENLEKLMNSFKKL